MKNKKVLTLTILGILSLIVITVGVTYAFFSYTKEGTTENTITTGTITFLYTEVSGVGRGISIDDAYPISDEVGKVQTGEGKVFDFKVTSTTQMNASIPYEVTARKKSDSTLDESAVKLYLTKVDGTEEEVLLDNYSNLTQTDKMESSRYVEKTIYTGKVPANSTNYEQNFRLRMWIDEEVDFSQNEDGTYPYNDKTFTVTVNVYASAKVVTEEDIQSESTAEISSLSVEGTELTKVENQDYDYETSLPEGTTTTTINIETQSENATVNVEKLNSLAYSSNIKRLAATKTLELTKGDNYFKITVISENKKVENEYTLKIYVDEGIPTLSEAVFNKYTTIYENPTLTDSSNNTSDASGLYKSTATNSGDPTYYFRGNVTNNYVDFAGFTWRVVRINEDGTIRLVMQDGINNNAPYNFNPNYVGFTYMYYSKSNVQNGAKYILDNWYKTNIEDKEYSSYVATGDYYCEQAKVKQYAWYTSGNETMTVYSDYTPNFKCESDANGYGIVNTNIGLLTYDEVVYAGGYNKENTNYYLFIFNTPWWTMSPSGVTTWNYQDTAFVWYLEAGLLHSNYTYYTPRLRPVINLKADVTVKGDGSNTNHWVVQ